VTFNGPALLTDFAEFPRMLAYTEASFLKTLGQSETVGPINPSSRWTEETLDWRKKKDLKRPRKQSPSPGWTWLKPGQAQGKLIGGCLESLEHLRGTRFWPNWDGAIFFFETSEENPPPAEVDGILMDYENMGVMGKLAGLIVGRPMAYNEEEKQQLREVILARTEAYSFPIISDMDFGHTSPQFILPIGCQAHINSEQQLFELTEAAVI
jgi:muramoyltetrapeptide carboxypeptidase LdcA involved in peptidoglycan recycling